MLFVFILYLPTFTISCASTSPSPSPITSSTTSSTTSTSTSTSTSTTSSTSTTTTTTTPTCPTGWSQFGTNCFMFVDNPVLEPEAQAACVALGGNLASMHSAAENMFLNTLSGGRQTWIGVVRTIPGVNMFKNVDGTPFDYVNWDTGNPDNPGGMQDCMVINYTPNTGSMNTINCSVGGTPAPFICEKPL